MGVSTLLIEDRQTQILIDGFFTRPHWFTVKFGMLKPHIERIQRGLCRGGVDRPAAVLVAHGHYDHAMDAAEIVAARGGKLIGSRSIGFIGHGRNLPDQQIETFEGERTWTFGALRVTAIPAPHGSPDRWEGEITTKLQPPVKADAYRNGGASSFLIEREGLRILVHPSAGAAPGLYSNRGADVVFLGVGGLGKKDVAVTAALWKEAVTRTGASMVYPIHWDNFTRTLDHPLTPAPLLDNVPKTFKRLADQDGAQQTLCPPLQAFECVTFSTQRPRRPCPTN